MKYELNLRDARKGGEATGEAKGKALTIRVWHLLQEKVSLPEIALKTDLPLKEVVQIAPKFGVVY